MYAGESIDNLADVCWQCERKFRGAELICGRCGATRVTSVASARLSGSARELMEMLDSFASHETGDAANSPTDSGAGTKPSAGEGAGRTRHKATTNRPSGIARAGAAVWSGQHADVLLSAIHGALGAFIGAGLWCVIATIVHGLVGPMAIAVGFLVGMGTAMDGQRRGIPLTLIAILLTAATWEVCVALITSQGVTFGPLDIAFCAIGILASAFPTELLPRYSAR